MTALFRLVDNDRQRRPMDRMLMHGGRGEINNTSEFAAMYEANVREENRMRYTLQSQRTNTGKAAALPSLMEARSHAQ